MQSRVSRLHLLARARAATICIQWAEGSGVSGSSMPVSTLPRLAAACPGAFACRFRSCNVSPSVYWPGLTPPKPKTRVLCGERRDPQWPVWKADVGHVLFASSRVMPCVHDSLVCVIMLQADVSYRVETTEEDMDARLPHKRKHEKHEHDDYDATARHQGQSVSNVMPISSGSRRFRRCAVLHCACLLFDQVSLVFHHGASAEEVS